MLGSAGMLEVRQRWNGECFVQATVIKHNRALEPVPRVAQSTQLRQEKSQQVLPIIWKFSHKLLTGALERSRIIMVIKQDFFIEKETNFMMTKHHSSLLFQVFRKKHFYFPVCTWYSTARNGGGKCPFGFNPVAPTTTRALPAHFPEHEFCMTIRQNKMGKKLQFHSLQK